MKEIELPDGTIAEFPDDMDDAAIAGVLRKQFPSPAVSPEESDIPTLPTQEESDRMRYDPSKGMGAGQSLLVGIGKGMTDIGRGLGLVDKAGATEKAGFAALEQRRPVSAGVGEVVGQAAPFVPLAIGASMAAPLAGLGATGTQALNIAGQGLAGALESGTIARGTDKDVVGAATTGGALAAGIEAVSPVFGRGITAVYRKLTGKVPTSKLITPDGKPSAELSDALQKNGLTIDDITEEAKNLINPEATNVDQVARKAFLESQGLEPTRAQVTRGATDFQSQQEAAKVSSRVRDALEKQEAVLTTRFNNAIIDTGGQATSPTSSVIDSVVNKASTLDNEEGRLYKLAKERAPDKKQILFRGTKQKLDSLMQADAATNGAISAIKGDLINRGILRSSGEISGIPATEAYRKVDANTAEEARKFINSLYDPQNPFRNQVLREVKDSLDEDVFKWAGEDIYRDARKAKANFESELSRSKVSKFDDRKANIVRDILENKVNPDRFVDDVVYSKKWRSDDLEQLKNYITTDDAGKSAFDDLRAETLNSIKNKAFIGPEDAAGNRSLSRDALERELKSIGKPKLEILFTPEEQKFLADMMRIAKLREPVKGTALGKGPSAQGISQAIAKLENRLKDLPMMGTIVNMINLDAQGRIVLKAPIEKAARKALPYEKEVGSVVGTLAVPLTQQEQ